MIFNSLVQACRKMTGSTYTGLEYLLNIDGNTIRVCCKGFEPSGLMLSSLRDLVQAGEGGETENRYDYESFYCFRKSLTEFMEFLPEDLRKTDGRYVYSGADGRLAFSVEYGFFSLYSAVFRETWIWLCPEMHSLESFISHPLHMELSWWALRKGMSFLHSAAVGYQGKGVLISGAGGSGKSTLSMSALLSGMEFLSDDYLLMKNNPEPTALRIYSSGYLKEDILEQLPELRDAVFWTGEERKKSLIDLKVLNKGGNVVDRLPIHAVILPHIVHADEPLIRRSSDLRRLIPLLASTSYQNRELKNKDVFYGMMRLFRDIPAFDYYLTDDIGWNADYLKGWVRNL